MSSSSSSSCCCCSEYEKQKEQQQEELNFKEESLRRFLKDKPRNARKMSELSMLLSEKASSASLSERNSNNNHTKNRNIKEEALEWAQRAIQVASTKPFGYVALSVVLEHENEQQLYERRIEALRSAIQYISAPTTTTTATATSVTATVRALWVTRIVLLVRLMLEPRLHELLDGNSKLAKTSALHPSRRLLNAHENVLYQQIKAEMSLFSSCSSLENNNNNNVKNDTHDCGVLLTAQQHETLAMRCDYRLGLFLRKKLPAQVYLPMARFHLQRAVTRLETIQPLSSSSSSSPPPRHPKLDVVQFWLATMNTTHDTYSNSNVVVPTRIMDRCPKDYVIGLYSTFAERFDDLLVNKLDYQTPALLRQLVQQAILIKNKQNDAATYYYFHKAVDLGCGTGLSGMAFRDLIAPLAKGGSLTGIDLSPQMIAKAKLRQSSSPSDADGNHDAQSAVAPSCYDVLLVGDLEQALDMVNNDDGSDDDDNLYSLVFACDVFCYIGDLKQIFRRVYNALTKRGGIFAFSVEMLLQLTCTSKHVVPFQLHECARFAHSQDYLNDLARDCGFSFLQTQTCPIRKNQGENVMGLLYVLEKGKRRGS